MNTNDSGIYCIRSLANNKCYIGSAKNFSLRKNEHFYELRNNKHANIHLQNSWNKYGENNFIFEILCYVEDVSNLTYIED
jgi:group I intron endonuclease